MRTTSSSFHAMGMAPLLLATTLAAQTVWTPATREAVPEILASGLTPGGFRLEMAAPPGNYRLERSTTLLEGSWLDLDAIEPVFGVGEITDPGALGLPAAFYRVAGGFQETRMKLISLNSTLERSSFDDPEDPFEWGGMWTRQSQDNLLFQTAQASNGLIRMLDGESGEFRVEPDIEPRIFTWVEQWNEPETFSVARSEDSWNVGVGEGLELVPVEGGEHSFMGIFREGDWTFSDGDVTTTERSLESLWVIAKSENAQAADLAGDWGFVRILADGYESDGLLDGLAFATSITAGPNPRTLPVNNVSGFEIEHEWSTIPAGVFPFFYEENPNDEITLNLAADGGVTLNVPGENLFKGMVSPSAKLLVAAASTPDIMSDPDNLGLASGEVQWLVGVKRDNTPALAGKTYRILRQGWWVEGDFFEIDRSSETDRLMFNGSGTSVTRTSEFNYDAVSFDGVFASGSDPVTLDMDVSVDAQGQILMEAGEPGDFTIKTRGYARQGSGLLVLVDAIEIPEDLEFGDPPAAGLGLIIAIEEP